MALKNLKLSCPELLGNFAHQQENKAAASSISLLVLYPAFPPALVAAASGALQHCLCGRDTAPALGHSRFSGPEE